MRKNFTLSQLHVPIFYMTIALVQNASVLHLSMCVFRCISMRMMRNLLDVFEVFVVGFPFAFSRKHIMATYDLYKSKGSNWARAEKRNGQVPPYFSRRCHFHIFILRTQIIIFRYIHSNRQCWESENTYITLFHVDSGGVSLSHWDVESNRAKPNETNVTAAIIMIFSLSLPPSLYSFLVVILSLFRCCCWCWRRVQSQSHFSDSIDLSAFNVHVSVQPPWVDLRSMSYEEW